jgi:hypothetical protein
MKRIAVAGLLAACALLGGCNASQPVAGSQEAPRGRYTGVGLYAADSGWARIEAGEASTDKGAKPSEDTIVIVVVDTNSGEVRQCGNLSGRCVAMNPWTKNPGKAGTAPLVLREQVSNEAAPVADNAAE